MKQLDNIQMWNDARVVDEGTGETPLLAACAAGSFEICEALINAGADVRAADKDGNTPLLAACGEGSFGLSGNSDVVRLLMKAGADVAAKDLGHQTCLHWAAGSESSDVVGILLEAGATDKEGNTADVRVSAGRGRHNARYHCLEQG